MIKNCNNTFHIQTKNTSYIFKVVESLHVVNLYYGRKIRHKDSFDNLYSKFNCITGTESQYDRKFEDFSLNLACLELSTYGKSDYRQPSLHIVCKDNSRTSDFLFKDFEIISGKPEVKGLPHFFKNNDDVETIILTLADDILGVEVKLFYSVFYDKDIITRHMQVISKKSVVRIERAMSFNLDFPTSEYDFLSLTGDWIREKNVQRFGIKKGIHTIDSKRLLSGSEHNPFFALLSKDTTEHQGDCYGFGFVYSGNHEGSVEVSGRGLTRLQMGINSFDFSWNLAVGETFTTPEVVLTYSDKGINGMSQNFHKAIRENLVSKQWQYKPRPILFNSWEAMYFDYNESKLVKFAKTGRDLGMELFVLDDGWFKGRNDDTTSLGDWFEDEKKLPNGLEGLSKKITKMGLKFGLWVESEMVSENSYLATKHPEWIVRHKNRQPSLGRNQLMLDLANDDVVDYLFKTLSDVFKRANVSYVKWDCNRCVTDVYSNALSAKDQQSFSHKYYLGLYRLLDQLKNEFSDVLFESCASGGNRNDLGMIFYMPQTWVSDNSDPGARMNIQYGASIFMPTDTIGAHVGSDPSHQVLRKNDIETRYNMASFGALGYELNLNHISKYEKKVIKQQVKQYKKKRQLLQFGTFYRLASPFDSNNCIWMVVDEKKENAILGYYQKIQIPNSGFENIKLKGLDEETLYNLKTRAHYINIEQFGELINYVLPVKISTNGIKGLAHKTLCENYMYDGEQIDIDVFGDQLMYAGFRPYHQFVGTNFHDRISHIGDFGSKVYYISVKSDKVEQEGDEDEKNNE